ncbi:MAG: mechanosensitive ion channel family protein [Planctomycetota bacterium]|nr:mechanosensitive ion channel family protein [Planctomycetota bacterium]
MILALIDFETTVQGVADREWFGNPVSTWIRAAIVLIATFLALGLAKRLIVARLAAVAARTETELDDLIIDLVKRTKRWFLFLVALYVAHHFITWPMPDLDADGKAGAISVWEKRIGQVLSIGTWIQVGLWGRGVLQYGIQRMVRGRGPDDAASTMGVTVLGFIGSLVLWTLILLQGLDSIGVPVTSLIASLGVGGIAVALAAQNVLGDLFASIAILLDKPFVVGDGIQVGDFNGSVEKIGVKTTRLRSVNGEEIVMGNSDLISSRIRNFKRLQERRVITQIGVEYDTPVEQVAAIPSMLKEIVSRVPDTRFDRAHFTGFGDSALKFELVYFAQKLDYGSMMDMQQAVNLEILRRFEAERIQFAFPTQTMRVVPSGAPTALGGPGSGPHGTITVGSSGGS